MSRELHQPRAEPVSANEMHQLVALFNAGRYAELEAKAGELTVRDPASGLAWKVLGATLGVQGKDALPALQRAAQLLPHDAESHNNVGNALCELGQFEAAAASCRRALELKPNFAEAHNNLGNALLGFDRPEEALSSYHRALELKPHYAEAHSNLGHALRELGQLDEAAASCRRALELKPHYAEAHSNLGHALLELGQLDEAAASCRRALDIKPDFAEAHNNLGNVLLKLGELYEALASYRRALELRAQYAEAHNNAGNVLLGLGHLDEALASCRRALEVRPDFAEAHNNLGNVLLEFGQRDAAVASYRRAFELKPRYTAAHVNLSIALERLGRIEEAEASCRTALEIKADAAMAIVILAGLRTDQGRFAEAEVLYQRAVSIEPNLPEAWAGIPRVRKMTASDSTWVAEAQRVAGLRLPPRKEAQLRYAIGKYFDDVQDFEQAFTHYRRANELSRLLTAKYDKQRVTRVMDRMIQSYGRTWLNRTRIDANASRRPVFIVGMPRSGTTLTEQILASHPAVFGAGEQMFWRRAAAAHQASARSGQMNAGIVEGLAQEYLALLANQSADALRVVDQMHANFQHLGLIHAALPNARIIHIRRNPVDTCLSMYFQNFSIDHSHTDLEDLAHYYGEYRRVMGYWRSILPADATLEVSYEELVEDQEGWSRKMIEFVGLEWDPRCLDFHQTSRTILTASNWQVRQKISRSSVARWRNYEPFVGPLLHLMEEA